MTVRPKLSNELWQKLNTKKQSPNESIEDVIWRLLEQADRTQSPEIKNKETRDDSDDRELIPDGGQVEAIQPELPSEARERIRQRCEGLQAVANDGGSFSEHAVLLLELANCVGGERQTGD